MSEEQIIVSIASNVALGHLPTDDDCARATQFLASEYAKVVSGATLDANGVEFMP